MTNEDKPKSGSELLADAKTKIKERAEGKFTDLVRKTVELIEKRKTWIKARQSQIAKIENIQKDMVKLFDAGEFDEDAHKRFTTKLQEIEKFDKGYKSADPFEEEDED